MGDAGTMSVLAQDTLTGAGVQSITGAKTFNNQTLKLRNPANTFSLTFQDPPITSDQTYRLNQPYKYFVFREGSTVYCRNQITQDIESSGPTTTPETVIQYALDHSLRASINVQNGSYTMSAGFTGLNVSQEETTLVLDPGTLFTVPAGYTGDLFNITGVGGFQCIGGRFSESATVQRLWTCFHFKGTLTGSAISVTNNILMNGYIRQCDTGIKLEVTDTTSFVNGNVFSNYHIDTFKKAIVFVDAGDGTGIGNNWFGPMLIQSSTGISTNGVKDIQGKQNVFAGIKVWDMEATGSTSNILSTATDTLIIGGIMTPTNFTDLGSKTTIIEYNKRQLPGFDMKAQTAPSNPATGTISKYVKTLDSNNDGLFYKARINGTVVEVLV